MALPLGIGHRAPKIALPSTEGRHISLEDYKGKKNVVLYFYPEDDTPGCTKEACAFRDSLQLYERADTVVLGVSTDGLERHKAFLAKYKLPFPLLSDEDAVMTRWFGVYDEDAKEAKRVTFLIGKDGLIKRVWENVRVERHAEEVLREITLVS
jgi:peroxiredoxin Q/BCP